MIKLNGDWQRLSISINPFGNRRSQKEGKLSSAHKSSIIYRIKKTISIMLFSLNLIFWNRNRLFIWCATIFFQLIFCIIKMCWFRDENRCFFTSSFWFGAAVSTSFPLSSHLVIANIIMDKQKIIDRRKQSSTRKLRPTNRTLWSSSSSPPPPAVSSTFIAFFHHSRFMTDQLEWWILYVSVDNSR